MRSWLRAWFGSSRSTTSLKRGLRVERLDDRTTPALLAPPWTDPEHLTLSFVPDRTKVAGTPSNLAHKLILTHPQWKRELLTAFQSWAVLGNINIALTKDGGLPLGTGGARQGDGRFGDIRVGGLPMTGETLGSTVLPDDTSPGTWAGDVIINTAARYRGKNSRDLFTIALHEAGHALGLDGNADPNSVMNDVLTQVFRAPGPSDVAALQALYGTRAPDRWDATATNDSLATATPLDTSGGFNGSTPLVVYGDVGAGDVDYYAIPALQEYSGPVTIRLQSAGRSLLAPRLSIVDGTGRVIRSIASTSSLGSTLQIRLTSLPPGTNYFVRVEGATSDVFAIGGYALGVTYDRLVKTPAARIGQVIGGPFETLSASEMVQLFQDPNHEINDDHGADDTLLEAQRLTSAPGFLPDTHYQALGSLALPTDVDSYRVGSPQNLPSGTSAVLTATVWNLDETGAPPPQIQLFDHDQVPVPSQVLANGNGVFTIQAAGLRAGRDYYVQVLSPDGSGLGNYSVTMDYGTQAASLSTFAGGHLTPTAPTQTFNLWVARTQLFTTLLAAQGGPVAMTVTNSRGVVVATLIAGPGETVGGAGLLLKPGAYKVTFRSLGDGTTLPPDVVYSLVGAAISDPIGPVATDPTATPQYQDPTAPNQYLYPNGTSSLQPFLWSLMIL